MIICKKVITYIVIESKSKYYIKIVILYYDRKFVLKSQYCIKLGLFNKVAISLYSCNRALCQSRELVVGS